MDQNNELDTIADAAIAAAVMIDKHGTQEMKTLSRLLLLSIGRELARRIGHGDEDAPPRANGTDPVEIPKWKLR